jgi:photosystem II stability/assembly factor-like uncharacterized protein
MSVMKLFSRYRYGVLACSLLFLTGPAWSSAYQDPIDLPAQRLPGVGQALLVDVTRVGERLVAVGERGHVLYSDDAGVNWSQAQVASRSHLNAVYFSSDLRGWAVGEDQVVLATSDGGQSWVRQFDDRDADQRGPFLDLVFADDNRGFAVGVFNKLFHTEDGGNRWSSWQEQIDNLDEWHLFAISSGSPDRFYIASEMGLMFRSTDAGNRFEAVQTDHDGSFHGVLARAGEDGLDRVLLFGVGGVIYGSDDGGDSWQQIDSGVESGLSGGTWLADGSALLVGADGLLLKVSADFQRVDLAAIDNGLPLSSVIQSADQRLVMVGLGGAQSYAIDQFESLR